MASHRQPPTRVSHTPGVAANVWATAFRAAPSSTSVPPEKDNRGTELAELGVMPEALPPDTWAMLAA